MDKPWKVISAFVGVFVAGAVFGGFFTLRTSAKRFAAERALLEETAKSHAAVLADAKRVPTNQAAGSEAPKSAAATPSAPASRPQDRIVLIQLREISRRLNPTAEQLARIRVFMSRANEDVQRLGREHWQDTARVNDRMYEDIAALLTPEQQVQLEKMRQETLERVRRAREKQREEALLKSSAARTNGTNVPGQPNPNRKSASPEGANPK
jgi:hypothetical protein